MKLRAGLSTVALILSLVVMPGTPAAASQVCLDAPPGVTAVVTSPSTSTSCTLLNPVISAIYVVQVTVRGTGLNNVATVQLGNHCTVQATGLTSVATKLCPGITGSTPFSLTTVSAVFAEATAYPIYIP